MKAGRLFLGMIAGNLLGAGLCVLAREIVKLFGGSTSVSAGVLDPFLAYPSLLLIPFAIGVVAARVWQPLKLRIGETLLQSFLCTLVGLAGAWAILHEGVICLVMASPIILAGIVAGAITGRIWFRDKNASVNLCLAPFAVLAIAAEPMLSSAQPGVVVDELRIAAPPARIWPHVLAFEEIPEPPKYWLFHLGLPYPTRTTNGGNFVGASRACEFSGGLVFEERVAEFEPERLLTFDITKAPAHPELLGHLDTHRGQFELRDNGDGTTTLIGRSWYSLHVRPGWYFHWWTRDACRAVHLRVMKNVQRLAESAA